MDVPRKPDAGRIVHFSIAAHPTVEWSGQQLHEAFPWSTAPGYLWRDRDQVSGDDFAKQVMASSSTEPRFGEPASRMI